jgi:hypothetical protein
MNCIRELTLLLFGKRVEMESWIDPRETTQYLCKPKRLGREKPWRLYESYAAVIHSTYHVEESCLCCICGTKLFFH